MTGPHDTIQLIPPQLETSPTESTEELSPVLLPIRPLVTARVLHVINGEHFSGAERVQDLLALRLPDEGFEVDFAAVKPDKFGQFRRSKVRLESVPMRSRIDYRAVGRLKQLVRRHDYQILHAHTPRSALITAVTARSLGLPWVYHVHSPVSLDSGRPWQVRINSMIERFCLRSASRVIVVAPSLKPYMLERGVPESRLVCVPNGVPAIDLDDAPTPNDPAMVLGMVALFRPRKGTEVLLEALAAAVSLGHNVKLRAIGGFETPEYEDQIRARAEKLLLADRVEFTGFTTDISGELAKLDAMVLPSLYGEGLPMVVLEAMAAGVPVIASHVEGASAAVEHRRSGILVEPGSVSQLTDAIIECATGEVNLVAMAAEALARHRAEFSDVAMARGVASVYQELLAEAALNGARNPMEDYASSARD